MKRREFIKAAAPVAPFFANVSARGETSTQTWEEFLRASAVPGEIIDRFLKGPSWAQFDPELGYIPWNFMPADGVDHSASISTVQANGARTAFMYVGKACRINTYGDSMTHCDQVNDGETWQEYLAAHFGEPIRNFGVGGYGVYQAYRRMVREERTDHAAEYVTLYICCDDHIRSLLRCRHAIAHRHISQDRGGTLFHGNFWHHLEMELESGAFVEKENVLTTTASLYRMTDPQFMRDQLHDDMALQLYAYKLGYIRELDHERISKLAAHLNYHFDWNREDMQQQVTELLDRYSQAGTKFVLGKARDFCHQNGKKLLVIVFDPFRAMAEMVKTGRRYDQEIVDYLARENFNYFDMNEVQLQDFKKYNIPLEEYFNLYLIGHYTPRGNHFFAFSIKDTLVKWLDPKPISYRNVDPDSIDWSYISGCGLNRWGGPRGRPGATTRLPLRFGNIQKVALRKR